MVCGLRRARRSRPTNNFRTRIPRERWIDGLAVAFINCLLGG